MSRGAVNYGLANALLHNVRQMRKKLDAIEKMALRIKGGHFSSTNGRPPIALPPEEIATATSMYVSGMSLLRVSRLMGYSKLVIERNLVEAGVKMRRYKKRA